MKMVGSNIGNLWFLPVILKVENKFSKGESMWREIRDGVSAADGTQVKFSWKLPRHSETAAGTNVLFFKKILKTSLIFFSILSVNLLGYWAFREFGRSVNQLKWGKKTATGNSEIIWREGSRLAVRIIFQVKLRMDFLNQWILKFWSPDRSVY